jgi:PKD repeat protein
MPDNMIEILEEDNLITGQIMGIYSSNGAYAGPMIELVEEDNLIYGYLMGLYSGGIAQNGTQIEVDDFVDFVSGSITMPLPPEEFHITRALGVLDEVYLGATYPKVGDNMRLLDYLEDPRPDADFTSNRVDGIAPFAVQFSDLSTHGPIAWRWNFGDGRTSRQQNPVHTFLNPGRYTIILRVYSYTQMDTIVRVAYIRAGVLDFQSNKTSGPVKLKCRFNAEIVLP